MQAQQLKQIFGIAFQPQDSILALRQFHHANAFCCNAAGEVIGISATENNFSSLSLPLQGLEKLEYLNLSDNKELATLKFAGALPLLQHLDVSSCGLKALELPAGFAALQDVYAACNRYSLKHIRMAGNFPELRLLDVAENEALTSLPARLADCPKLEMVYVKGSPIRLGEEDLSGAEGNAWLKMRGYLSELYKDEQRGIERFNYRAKMIVVGNGRVGKTSMIKRLRGEAYNAKEKYTHGVSLGVLEQKHLPAIPSEDFKMNIWDFGGQEIFYAMHQFFMTPTALYVLAWTQEANVREYRARMKAEDAAISVDEKWRDEQYWLENILAYSKGEAPVLMVQTHADRKKSVVDGRFENAPYSVSTCDFSAVKDYGLPLLKDLLIEKLNDLPYFGKAYPSSYDEAISLIEKESRPFLTRKEFDQLCDRANIDPENRADFLEYLDLTGVCVHYPDNPQLANKIFIDPKWLTSVVYAVLNKQLGKREGSMNLAYVTARLAELKAKEKIAIGTEDLLALLKNFKLIFEIEEQNEQGETSKVYIYPDYLPEQLDAIASKFYRAAKKDLPPAFVLRFKNYLPENVLINIISHYGPDMTDNVVWKNGIYFTHDGEKAIIEFSTQEKQFLVFTGTSLAAKQLQKKICEKFAEVGRNTAMEIAIDPTKGWVAWKALKEKETHNAFVASKDQAQYPIFSTVGKPLCFKDFAHLVLENWKAEIDAPVSESSNPPSSNAPLPLPNIYFSYAWRDEGNPDRELLVTDLYNTLTKQGFPIKRDKEQCSYGEYIDEFIAEIGGGDLILVFVSHKYLRSLYCMTELFSIAQKSGWNKFGFKERIVPIVVEEVSFDDNLQEDLLEYWGQVENQKVEYKKNNAHRMDSEAISDLEKIIDTSRKISKLFFWLKKLNRGSLELYKENGYANIKKIIMARLSEEIANFANNHHPTKPQ